MVSGILSAPANLGGSLLSPVGASDVAVAEYASSDGSHLFSTRFGGSSPAGTGIVYGHMDVLDSSGAPIIEGTSKCDPGGTPICNEIDVGLGLLAPGGGSDSDGFVGRYSVSTGQPTWVDRLIGQGDDLLVVSARGPNDTIFTAGWFDQSTSFVTDTNTQTAQAFAGAGDRDIIITQMNDVTGAVNMTKAFADPAFEQPTGIAWTGTNIIASGFFSGTMTAFGRSLTSNDFDVWVAKLMPNGTPVWIVQLGGSGPDKYPYLAVDAAGDIYIAGTVSGSAMFGTSRQDDKPQDIEFFLDHVQNKPTSGADSVILVSDDGAYNQTMSLSAATPKGGLLSLKFQKVLPRKGYSLYWKVGDEQIALFEHVAFANILDHTPGAEKPAAAAPPPEPDPPDPDDPYEANRSKDSPPDHPDDWYDPGPWKRK